MIELPYSLVIEATGEPDFFGFYSPDLGGFTGIGHSVEDCLHQAKSGMKEHIELLAEQGPPVPLKNENPIMLIRDEQTSTSDIDLVLPPDFAVGPYEAIQQRVSVELGESHPDSRREFAGGWNALRYRYIACCGHDRDFTLSIQSPQTNRERYYQERDLFGFFVTGQSAIESLGYALYAIASVIRLAEFPVRTGHDLMKIKLNRTARLCATHFPGEALTIALDDLTKSPVFSSWQTVRNILAHRATPGRIINIGGPQNGIIEWSGIRLDHETTSTRRRWLAKTIAEVLQAADNFTLKHLSTKSSP